MPTYEYECGACGQRFERFQTISDAPVTECPDCHGEVKRLLSGGGGFIMKGSATATHTRASSCNRETPCCGRAERCDTPHCH